MTQIAGNPLPAVIDSITVEPNHHVEFRVSDGTLVLRERGTFTIDSHVAEFWDSESAPRSVSSGASHGGYERTDSTITLRFTDNEGVNRVFVYHILDGGDRISGYQWGRLAEYRRE